MLPKGFKIGGVKCGIYKTGHKKDIAVFVSDVPANAAGMFTQSVTKAAPVLFDIALLKKNRKINAIIANSGCANACTNKRGLRDAEIMATLTQEQFNLPPDSVLNASTGVIGQYLPMEKIAPGIAALYTSVGNSPSHEKAAVEAIMTTDTYPKYISKQIKSGKNTITVWACVKGSGMIHPDMSLALGKQNAKQLHATMLSFILTDAEIETKQLNKCLETAVEQSFNCVSVDGDTSTNDTVIILANGSAGKISIKKFQQLLNELTLELAKEIARDGEGATKFIEIDVKNAKTYTGAKKIAATIATSPLFKTAIFGRDANWGRVIAAAGRAGVVFDPYKINIFIGTLCVCKNGMAVNFSEEKAAKILNEKEIKVVLDLQQGKASAKYYTCDLSIDYVKINGDYRS
jgi:glutamate N-acetyltransferase/amino-acid N-acetyltransferase